MRRESSSRSNAPWADPPRALLAAALLLAAIPAAGQERVCSDYLRLAERAVPETVSSADYVKRLLSPPTTRRPLGAAFEPERAATVLGDELASPATGDACDETTAHGVEESCNEAGSRLRFDREAGEIVYLAPERSFRATRSEENRVDNEKALAVARETFSSLGLPREELGDAYVRELFAAGRDPAGRLPATRIRAEVHVLLDRQVGGVPVFDSTARAAVGSDARIARLRLRWPDFRLAEGLAADDAMKREEVVREVARRLSEETGRCEGWNRLDAYVAYVPADELEGVERGDESQDETAGRIPYVPALVIYAAPADPDEDSGEIVSAGLQISVPLFRAAPVDRADETEQATG